MYPTTIYRVSAKAFITNDKNQVLVVRETGDYWGLPGGGLDHGETAEQCIMREMNEEMGVSGVQVGEIAYSTTFDLQQAGLWMVWIIHKTTLNTTHYIFGDGVTDARFIDPLDLKDSNDIFEKAIYEISQNLAGGNE